MEDIGFGVKMDDEAFYNVYIGRSGGILITEFTDADHGLNVIDHDSLDGQSWRMISQAVLHYFNMTCGQNDLDAMYTWEYGDNLVKKSLGEELCTLVKIVKNLESDMIPEAVNNWLFTKIV